MLIPCNTTRETGKLPQVCGIIDGSGPEARFCREKPSSARLLVFEPIGIPDISALFSAHSADSNGILLLVKNSPFGDTFTLITVYEQCADKRINHVEHAASVFSLF